MTEPTPLSEEIAQQIVEALKRLPEEIAEAIERRLSEREHDLEVVFHPPPPKGSRRAAS